ncbi:MAG TPA: hypothetical protein VG841_16190 [Caulobacterales bacterium]|nr:hypothetical protein [Caulobacterales bacterium]
MNWMKTIAVATCFALTAGSAFADDLSGVWQGLYWGAGNQPTLFQVTLHDDAGPGFTGSTVELNNFGNEGDPFLLATLEGEVSDANITFTKTYDGTGAISHSVRYSGQIVSDRRIVGTWAAGGASGQFEMAR